MVHVPYKGAGQAVADLAAGYVPFMITRKRFVSSGAEPVGNTPEEFAARIRADIEKWGRVVRTAGIKPE